MKIYVCTQPVLKLSITDPGGAPIINSMLFFTRGNMKRGGMNNPEARPQSLRVVVSPFSPDVIPQTCLRPILAIILGGLLGTVVTPFSSTLKMRSVVTPVETTEDQCSRLRKQLQSQAPRCGGCILARGIDGK